MDYVDAYAYLRYDQEERTMMSPTNTPHRDVGLSPAEIFYAQAIEYHLTILGDKHQIPKRWREKKELREKALAKRHQLNQK